MYYIRIREPIACERTKNREKSSKYKSRTKLARPKRIYKNKVSKTKEDIYKNKSQLLVRE